MAQQSSQMPNEIAADLEIDLYGDIFRCDSFSDCAAENSVRDFVLAGPKQTVPVSHFGNIGQSSLWLVLNNPKGDRTDPGVNTSPHAFGALSRADLSREAIVQIKRRFDSYFDRADRSHSLFAQWYELLDGICVAWKCISFSARGICAVDLIKCPTKADWMGYVMTTEGKKVWNRCLKDELGRRHLLRQIDFHRPPVLVFAGTQSCVRRPWRGTKNNRLNALAKERNSKIIKSVWSMDKPRRISIGLESQRLIQKLDPASLQSERSCLQTLLDNWAPAP
jgi:hypothetical protein